LLPQVIESAKESILSLCILLFVFLSFFPSYLLSFLSTVLSCVFAYVNSSWSVDALDARGGDLVGCTDGGMPGELQMKNGWKFILSL